MTYFRISWLRRRAVALVAGLLAAVAVWLGLPISSAASYMASGEAEGGQLAGNAVAVAGSDAVGASGSGAVRFMSAAASPPPVPPPVTDSSPPPLGGYFKQTAVGGWSSLPSDGQCAAQIHHSTWEPRPLNYKRNHVMPDAAAVHAAFTARPRAVGGAVDSRWDSWLLPRVDGQFTGTTDEIFQWAACKWGLPDDFLRATAVFESTWYQYLTYPSGRCVSFFSCGDFFAAASPESKVYCDYIDRFGHSYQADYGSGLCPQTFSIVGLKSWQAPAWGQMPDNQNGAFPFNRDSTAFALDYYAAEMRGCYEGWQTYLTNGVHGDLLGCGGSWLSGSWYDAAAKDRIGKLQVEMANPHWLQADWPNDKPGCNVTYGCPEADKY